MSAGSRTRWRSTRTVSHHLSILGRCCTRLRIDRRSEEAVRHAPIIFNLVYLREVREGRVHGLHVPAARRQHARKYAARMTHLKSHQRGLNGADKLGQSSSTSSRKVRCSSSALATGTRAEISGQKSFGGHELAKIPILKQEAQPAETKQK